MIKEQTYTRLKARTSSGKALAIPLYKDIREGLKWEEADKLYVAVVEENGKQYLKVEKV